MTSSYNSINIENNPQEIEKNIEKVENNSQLVNENSNNIINQTPLVIIRKKKEYKRFIKLVKEGKYTTAIISARLLQVDKTTILQWLKTPLVIKAMDYEVNNYVEKIQSSKDWKAHAYLLDKLEANKEEESKQKDLQQLIVINT